MTTGKSYMAKIPKRGEILLVPFPYSDMSTSKVRPAIVISSANYQKSQPDIIVGAITSNVLAATTSCDYILLDWLQAGLKMMSAFKPAIFTLDPKRIIHFVGSISNRDMQEIEKRLKLTLDL